MLLKIAQKEITVILVVLFVAGFFRFYNLNWDEKSYFHPDERNIAMAVTKIQFFDDLNPEFFAYGGLTIYLNRATADLINLITHETVWASDWGNINIIGRSWSAFFSTLAILPLYFFAKRLFGQRTALFTIILYTLTVTLIQSAHFGTTESLLVFFSILIAYTALETLQSPDLKHFSLLGLLCGLSAATKTSALSFLIFPGIAFYGSAQKYYQQREKLVATVLVFVMVGFVSFTLFSPYTLLSWDKFRESMDYESRVATGNLPVVYTLQFKDTLPYLFQIQNLLWQTGPILPAGLAGMFLLLNRFRQKREPALILLLAFPLLYFAYVGSWYTKFIRYMVPIVPFLVIFAAYSLNEAVIQLKTLGKWIVGLIILATTFWAIAFFSVYTRPQSKFLATEWIYQNIPQDSLILQEHWDDGLPIPWNDLTPNLYQIYQLTIYEPDGPSKAQYYANHLARGDYLIISSRRLYGTLTRRSDQYPLTSLYYHLLFAGDLGYQKIAEFSSYPGIGPWIISDDSSEESFQVFDHPKVLIFKNDKRLSPEQIKDQLTRSSLAYER